MKVWLNDGSSRNHSRPILVTAETAERAANLANEYFCKVYDDKFWKSGIMPSDMQEIITSVEGVDMIACDCP